MVTVAIPWKKGPHRELNEIHFLSIDGAKNFFFCYHPFEEVRRPSLDRKQ